MPRSFVLLLATLLALTGATDALAEEGAGEEASASNLGYVEFRAGVSSYFTGDIDGSGFSRGIEYDTVGYVVGGAVGAYVELFDQDLRGELDVSYRESDVDESDGVGRASGTLEVLTAMANAYYDVDLSDVGLDLPVTPYVGVGVGVAWADPDFETGGGAYEVRDDSAEFAWNVLAGFVWSMNDMWDLNVGYRYFDMLDPNLDVTVGGTPTDADLEVRGHELLFGLRLPF